jgi:hypothetical protein
MLLRLSVVAGVLTLAASSAYANYVHVQPLGLTIVGLVIGAEIFKFAAPIAMAEHSRQHATIAFLATLVVWLLVVAFSFANTFGNALMRHAVEQAKLERAKASATRPEHVILKDIAALPTCKAATKQRAASCPPGRAEKLAALEGELKAARTRTTREEVAGHIQGDPIREGMTALAGFAGIELPPDRVFIIVTLIWTLLAEVGSALGGLAIPRRAKA